MENSNAILRATAGFLSPTTSTSTPPTIGVQITRLNNGQSAYIDYDYLFIDYYLSGQ